MNKIKFTNFNLSQNIDDIMLPALSCDSHHHIFDHRFPYIKEDKRNLPNATMQDYRVFKAKLGFERHIIVQPSPYGTDNRCLLDALKSGGKNCRGEAVIDEYTTEQELIELADAGVVGIRFNFCAGKSPNLDQFLYLANKAAEYGWHIQLHTKPEFLTELLPYLNKVNNPIVLDHFCSFSQPQGINHPAWKGLVKLMDKGKCWVKLSGLYHCSQKEDFSDLEPMTKALLTINSERLVWGSDWPHPSLTSSGQPMPDDKFMLYQIYRWLDSDSNRNKIFVENPTALFFR